MAKGHGAAAVAWLTREVIVAAAVELADADGLAEFQSGPDHLLDGIAATAR